MTEQIIIPVPSYAEKAIDILYENGYKGYIVGGCVRDCILGKIPNDYDICTDCTPEKMKEIFSQFRTIETGIKHGTLTVMIENQPLEITTFRSDGDYINHRKPEKVEFQKNLSADLSRRDFTINALCYNNREGLIDMFGGLDDIKNKTLRCIGNPHHRFDEDALRIMRAIRFSSVLDFEIDDETSKAVHSMKDLLNDISRERISSELKKLLCGKKAVEILMEYKDVIGVIIPQLKPCFDFPQNNPHHCYNVYEHICHSVGYVRPEWDLRLTMLLHDIGKPSMHTVDENGISHFKKHQLAGGDMSVDILKNLRLDSKSQVKIHNLIYEHDNRISAKSSSVKRFISKYDYDFFMDYLEVRRADTYAQSDYCKAEKLAQLDELAEIAIEIKEKECCLKLSDLAVNGNDLISAGCNGKLIGANLKLLLGAVIDEKVENNKEELLKYLSQHM